MNQHDDENSAAGSSPPDANTLGRTVVALFSDLDLARLAVGALHYAGFDERSVSLAPRDGGALVTVETNGEVAEAQAILVQHGADMSPGTMFDDDSTADTYPGYDRRLQDDLSYAGPERRLAMSG